MEAAPYVYHPSPLEIFSIICFMHTSFDQLRCVHQTCASCKFYNFYPGDNSCQVELDQEPTDEIKVAEAEWDSYLPKSDPSQNYFTEEMKFKGT